MCELHYQRARKGKDLTLPTKHARGELRRKNKREYQSWAAMKARCYESKHDAYARYGGRGVKVCERWIEFANFLEDMGVRPPNTSIDRIDSAGNYEPGNCRWATRAQQSINRKRAVHSDTEKDIRIKKLIDAGVDKEAIEYAMGVKL